MLLDAVKEIAETNFDVAERRRLRAKVGLPLHLSDVLIGQLEELNLAGRRRVPLDWEHRLVLLRQCLPPEVGEVPELRTRIATSRLLDDLFEIQDRLLDLKVGRLRLLLRIEEGEDVGDRQPTGTPEAAAGTWVAA